MKILFTVQNYYPAMSGVPVVVGYLAEGLVRKGHEVSVVTRLLDRTSRSEVINGVQVHRFPLGFSKLRGYTGEKEAYVSFVMNFETDILILECTQCETTDLLLPILGNLKSKKILHSHGFSGLTIKTFDMSSGLKHFAGNIYNTLRFKRYYRQFDQYIKDFDHFIYLSNLDSGKVYLDQRQVNRFSILENAADDMFLEASERNVDYVKSLGIEAENYLISVGNYEQIKNQKMILEAFYKAKIDSKYQLILIGSKQNTYYDYLKKLKKKYEHQYGKRAVFLLTKVPRVEIPTFLKNATLYLSSSKMEAYSVSIVEAMMSGIPFISTKVGNAQILPGGCVVESLEEMVSEIENLIKDQQRYRMFSEQGRNYALEHCRREIAISHLENILQQVDLKGRV